MLADEAGDEVVAVVVAVLHPQRERDAALCTGGLQALRKQLFGQEFVGGAVIDQRGRQRRAGLDQAGGVVRFQVFLSSPR